ncbi:MAG: ABC transporter ATP-binding protein [Rhodospirillaceae bacterium]|nr:ABC transporter ATP-binding protein [Rhodospirillaceae bacterium]
MLEFLKRTPFIQNYSRMWPYLRPYRIRALAAILITIPVGLMDAAIAWAMKPYMDIILLQKPSGYLLYLPLAIILFGLLQGTLNYASIYLNTWVGRKISNDLKMTLFDELIRSDAAFFDKETSGNIQLRFNGDADGACSGLVSNVRIFVTRIISSIALIGVLIYNSWIMALLAVVMLACALFPLTTVRRKIKSLVDESIFSGAQVATHYNETFSGNRVITSYSLAEYQRKRFRKTLGDVFKLGMKMTKRTGLISPMMHSITAIGIALVIWTGSYLILSEQMTPGNFVSFLTALIMLYTPIKGLGNNYNAVQMAMLAMERVWNVIDRPAAIRNKPDAIILDKISDGIAYRDVWFAYVPEKPVLKGVSLEVKVGETVALVGNSGGGKSTFSSLLPRFYDVTSGSIAIDGIDIRDIDLKSLRDLIAIVFQDNFLFAGTIRQNILLGRENATEDEIAAAVKNACLDEFISTLDAGLDTEIGERGVLLSGGQKQRVAIARAFLKNAPIVILDEATSALDNKSEAVVQEAIANLMQDRTVFVIAHRLSTIRNADKIVVINGGMIIEQGTHSELMEKKGAYFALYSTQIN